MTEISFIGHATVQIRTGGVRLLTDPLVRGRVAHLWRIVPPPSLAELEAPDAVLVSHAHLDHLDVPSLRLLNGAGLIVLPKGWARLARRAGFRDIAEVEVGDRVSIGAVEVVATPAEHDGRRIPLGRHAQALGYLITEAEQVYFAGDTDLFDGMRDVASRLDVALLPVAGWGPRLPAGHLDPERAARAAALLRARLAVPIHWGTLATPRGRPTDPERPAREFARLATSLAPDVDVRILRPGETLSLTSPSG